MANEYAVSGGSGTLRAQDYVAGAWRNGQALSVVSTVLTNTELVTANQAVRMAVTASASAEVELSVGVVT